MRACPGEPSFKGIIDKMRVDLRLECPDFRYALLFLFLSDSRNKGPDFGGHFIKADFQRRYLVGGIFTDYRILIQVKMLHGFFQPGQVPEQTGRKQGRQEESKYQDQKPGNQKCEKEPVHFAENGLIG